MYVPCDATPKDWSAYTLVLPSVCVGNVGQLTCDLLIATLNLRHQGYFYDDSILPIVGSDAFTRRQGGDAESFTLTTACQVYESEQHQVVVVQQRSPIVRGKKSVYVENLMKWAKDVGFKEVVILSSVFAHERIDSQLLGSQLRYVSCMEFVERHKAEMEEWTALEARPPPVGDRDDGLYLPGAGLAKTVHKKCSSEGLPSCILLRFCAEGDNVYDAVELASYLNSLYKWIDLKASAQKLGLEGRQGWKIPPSWNLPYGSRFEQVLYQ